MADLQFPFCDDSQEEFNDTELQRRFTDTGFRWPFHGQRGAARQAIEAVGAKRLYPPPHSPDFNPIEMAFSKLKAILRKAAARPIDELWQVIAEALRWI